MQSTTLRVKDLHGELGVSKGHASEILRGETSPSVELALRIFNHFGVKLGPIAKLTGPEIKMLEKVDAERVRQ